MTHKSNSGAKHLTDENFAQTIKESDKPVMVDFYAEWCGPCQMAAPIMDKLADELKDRILIVKVDVDQCKETAGKYGVRSIPTVMIFKSADGKIEKVKEKVGFPGEDGYRAMINEVLA
ncbi:MAG: thioredoxin [Patescibacteria group bacterium]|nr:thioredoxin [Patescibacteria group bacterium]